MVVLGLKGVAIMIFVRVLQEVPTRLSTKLWGVQVSVEGFRPNFKGHAVISGTVDDGKDDICNVNHIPNYEVRCHVCNSITNTIDSDRCHQHPHTCGVSWLFIAKTFYIAVSTSLKIIILMLAIITNADSPLPLH